ADNANGCVLISIALRPGQFFGGGLQLAETLLHHSRMVFWLIIRMTMLVMFQASSDIGHRTMTRGCDGRDATRSIGIACKGVLFGSNSSMPVAGMTIGGGAICSVF